MCLLVLKEAGHFVCKLFDSFAHITQSCIFICAQVFSECYVVKPKRSRIVNSERYFVFRSHLILRYLVGKFLQKEGDHKARFDFLLDMLTKIHERCANDAFPTSLVPVQTMKADELFMHTTCDMVEKLCLKETKALRFAMDRTDEIILRNKTWGIYSNQSSLSVPSNGDYQAKRRRRQ